MRQKRLLQGKRAISQILEKTDKVIKGMPTRAFLVPHLLSPHNEVILNKHL